MADILTLKRRSPLNDWRARFEATGPAIVLAEVPFTNTINLRVLPGTPHADALERSLGVRLPRDRSSVARSASADDLTVVWLAPDEFLLMSQARSAASMLEVISGSLARDGLEGDGQVAAVDVSAQRTAVALSGPQSRDLLAGGCSADLSAEAAPTGTTVQTMLAQAGVIILVTDADAGAFLLIVRASFADYLATWLTTVAVEYEPDGVAPAQ
ncbi:MAG: sarcosine oxidase subunit gamma [Candidatus Saccharibacteria bacterium]|nr:sarcosine oxidase subunit gamma [Microbacteriaceae bacterium]